MNLVVDLFGKLLGTLLLPPGLFIAMGLSGVWLSRRGIRKGLHLVTVALWLLLLASMPFIAIPLVTETEVPCESIQKLEGQADAIVVLGAGLRQQAKEYGGAPSVDDLALERLRHAARLQRALQVPVLVSGGSPLGGISEARVMEETLNQDFMIPVRWIEETSRTTRENASHSRKILMEDGVHRIYLVSQAWHLRRAVEAFRREGLTVIPAGTGCKLLSDYRANRYLPHPEALLMTYWAAHEWVGSLWYALLSLFESPSESRGNRTEA